MSADAPPAPGHLDRRLDRAWAILFARLVLGLIFFMAGVYKVFEQGGRVVVASGIAPSSRNIGLGIGRASSSPAST